MDAAAARHVGSRLLGEIEEGSLEELLDSLRTSLTNTPSHHVRPTIPFPELHGIIRQYQKDTQSAPPPVLSVSGRYLPLLYHLISTLIAEPHSYTVVLVDAEDRFEVSRLLATPPSASYPATASDLKHVHVYRPARGPEHTKAAVSAAASYMLYQSHGSREREWWGTVVVGGTGGDVNGGWRGWLRVEREEVSGFGFGVGVSVEEALREREKRQEAVDGAGWVASSRYGSYGWKAR